jgi:hypothetical protein
VSARLPIDDIRPPIDGEIKELELPERLEVPVRFIRGDTNGNGTVELADAVTTLSSLFLGTKVLSCADAADSNDDGLVAISDAIHTLSFLIPGRSLHAGAVPHLRRGPDGGTLSSATTPRAAGPRPAKKPSR